MPRISRLADKNIRCWSHNEIRALYNGNYSIKTHHFIISPAAFFNFLLQPCFFMQNIFLGSSNVKGFVYIAYR